MNTNRYTTTAIILHGLMAILLTALFILGIYMSDLPLSPWKLKLFSWHKWAGVSAFLLVSVRLAWRFSHHPPALPDTMTTALRSLAHFGHASLYLLMFAIPLSGWLMSSAKGYQTVYFGILPIPDLLSKDKELGEILAIVHETLNYVFAALVIGHIGFAIKHHLHDKDGVLSRMFPWLSHNATLED